MKKFNKVCKIIIIVVLLISAITIPFVRETVPSINYSLLAFSMAAINMLELGAQK